MSGLVVLLHAEGSPPLLTDDPGTPGDGHWEINLGVSREQRSGSRLSGLPLVDFNYGIGDRWQVMYAVSGLRLQEEGVPSVSGFGNSTIGVKWRFLEAGPAVSLHPQWEFNTPGASSDERGLVEAGSAFLLPVQFELPAGPLAVIGQAGREFRAAGDAWFYGLAVAYEPTARTAIAVELTGSATPRLDRTQLTANFAVAVDCSEGTSLLFSIGRELHNHDEPRATFVGYLGFQWRL
ncbi:MAG TPA: hypothetical protein VGD97_08940 [Lacunisphaera sp.]